MNSVIFEKKYKPVDGLSQYQASFEQMQWLKGQLLEADNHGEKVAISMHVPPGIAINRRNSHKTSWQWANLPSKNHSWLNQFLTLISKHENIVSGIFYGHTHMDEVRRLYDSSGTKMTAIGIGAPGVSPNHGNNPGFKLVYYEPQTKTIIDTLTHYTTPKANQWQSYYFSDEFNCGRAQTMFTCLNAKSYQQMAMAIDKIFMVKHGTSKFDAPSGVEVHFTR